MKKKTRAATSVEPEANTENHQHVAAPAPAPVAPEDGESRKLGHKGWIILGAIAAILLASAAAFALQLGNDRPQVHIDKPGEKTNAPQGQALRASTWSSDFKVMLQYAELYDELHPFIYSLKGRHNNPPEIASSWGHTQKLERIAALRAKNPKIRIIPTIFRWENPGEKINEVIGMNGRNDIRDKHIAAIVKEVETYGYDGIDIDYEGMTCNKKEKFEEFIEKLAKELHARNKLLSVAVHPKTPVETGNEEEEFNTTTNATAQAKPAKPKPQFKQKKCAGLKNPIVLDFNENWRGPLTHDYRFLGKHADMIKIMAYELHPRKYRNPGPGPQAPSTWLEEIIAYASDKVPVEKLYMAIPTYGYDWGLNCRAPVKSVYYSDVVRIRSREHKKVQPTDIAKILDTEKGATSWRNLARFRDIHEDKVYEDPSLWYRSGNCMRVAFYMDRVAFAEKMALLQKSRLAGFSFWQLTADNDPEIQNYLSTTLARAAK